MSWKLSIEFGGLCMFVQRKLANTKTGLFVLMPVMSEMRHEPVVEFGEGNSKLRVPLDGLEVDLTHLAAHGETPSTLAGMGNASGYAERSVEEKFLSARVAECLAARIVLPYGSPVATTGKPAKLKAEKNGAVQEILYGRARVELDVADSVERIEIAKATLFRDPKDAKVTIRMVNVMPDDLDHPAQKPHKKGQAVPHFSAYYRLLQDKCPDGTGPRLLVDCDASTGGDCQDTDKEPIKIFFVDPYNCTIGSGCQPGTINC